MIGPKLPKEALFQIKLAMKNIENREQDGTLLVLKSHLVIEELIRTKLAECLPHPEYMARANLSFFHVLCVARAVFPDELRIRDGQPSTWDLVEAWNTLRNRLAHKLEPTDTLPIIRKILYLDPNWPHPLEHVETQNALSLTVGLIIGALGSLLPPGKEI
jgi:hypothetical protein